jgi:hypothetical protein
MRPRLLLIIAILFTATRGTADGPTAANIKQLEDFLQTCPPHGTAKGHNADQNTLKARTQTPTNEDLDADVTSVELSATGNDENRWSDGNAAEITAYVVAVEPGGCETRPPPKKGGESCNCNTTEPLVCDTHITVVARSEDWKEQTRHIVVEITPRWRLAMAKQGVDWRTDALRAGYHKKWVRFRGWLFFDDIHKKGSENTAPGNPNNWRATAWEIHPVTSITLTTKPSE